VLRRREEAVVLARPRGARGGSSLLWKGSWLANGATVDWHSALAQAATALCYARGKSWGKIGVSLKDVGVRALGFIGRQDRKRQRERWKRQAH
jgi:hypothetical protein